MGLLLRYVGPVGALAGGAGFQPQQAQRPPRAAAVQPADGGGGWSHHGWLNGLWGPGPGASPTSNELGSREASEGPGWGSKTGTNC